MGGVWRGAGLCVLSALVACGSISDAEAVQQGCETSCRYRLECRFGSPAGVPACAMACPETTAAASSECRSAYEALGRCVDGNEEVACPGFLSGFCGEEITRVRMACDGELIDGGMRDAGDDMGTPADLGPVDLGAPSDAGEDEDMGTCVPATCESMSAECGTIANSCGGAEIRCPACEAGFSCDGNTCVAGCAPNRNETGQAAMAVSAGAGDDAWAMPDAARMTADGQSASVTLRFTDSSQDLRLTDWGFELPSGATVDGVGVSVNRAANGNTVDEAIQLIAGGDPAGSPKTVGGNWPSAPTNESYGNSTDTWGASLNRAIVNASDFGVLVRARHTGGAPTFTEVEHVSMTVYYSVTCP
ncbi:MAG: hypothetical protein JJ863_36455 [Deltaproteobacteria bacterium]|nr:hypothetical protein [Deltaproteobacteria bacterium]